MPEITLSVHEAIKPAEKEREMGVERKSRRESQREGERERGRGKRERRGNHKERMTQEPQSGRSGRVQIKNKNKNKGFMVSMKVKEFGWSCLQHVGTIKLLCGLNIDVKL